MPQEEEKIIDPNDFSFKPGSSVPPIEKNIHSKRRKIPPYYPTPTTPAAAPNSDDPSHGVKISLATDLLPERCTRKVNVNGSKRGPALRLPPQWMVDWNIDWKHPKNAHNEVMLERSADRKTIIMKPVEPPEGMREPVEAKILAVDSDAAAEADEEKKSRI